MAWEIGNLTAAPKGSPCLPFQTPPPFFSSFFPFFFFFFFFFLAARHSTPLPPPNHHPNPPRQSSPLLQSPASAQIRRHTKNTARTVKQTPDPQPWNKSHTTHDQRRARARGLCPPKSENPPPNSRKRVNAQGGKAAGAGGRAADPSRSTNLRPPHQRFPTPSHFSRPAPPPRFQHAG